MGGGVRAFTIKPSNRLTTQAIDSACGLTSSGYEARPNGHPDSYLIRNEADGETAALGTEDLSFDLDLRIVNYLGRRKSNLGGGGR